jgi:hypothetical protein
VKSTLKNNYNHTFTITVAASSLSVVVLFCLEVGLVTTESSSRNLSIPERGIIKCINKVLELAVACFNTYSRRYIAVACFKMEITKGVLLACVIGSLPLLGLLTWWWNEICYVLPLKFQLSGTATKLPPGHLGFPFVGEMLTYKICFPRTMTRPLETQQYREIDLRGS